LTATFYGSVRKAEDYFSQRLRAGDWDDALASDRVKALFMATRSIDLLNFEGEKHNPEQEHQFPRGADTEVPEEIEIAAYECALAYLSGISIDQEIRSIGVSSFNFGGVQDTFVKDFVPEHLRAGIPCAEAWIYLRPFLRDPQRIIYSRAS
jgi:hypothetical protein